MNNKILYYGFGGGLGHITRFMAFCHTLNIKPILMTALKDVVAGKLETLAEEVLLLPENCVSNKNNFRKWFHEKLTNVQPERIFIDAFPGGILGELCDFPELNELKIEYISRILNLKAYKKRLNGKLPRISKIWQVEPLGDEQLVWQKTLAAVNNAEIERLDLEYPSSDADAHIELPDHCWLIVHSGSAEELLELWEYANETAMLEGAHPCFAVVGQCARPEFLPPEVPYYSVYPVTSLLEKAEKVVSAAGFNIMRQMRNMKEKHLVLPFKRALDEQGQRLLLYQQVFTPEGLSCSSSHSVVHYIHLKQKG